MVSWPHYLPVTGSCISSESCLHANSYILWYHDIRIRMCYFITRNHRKIAFRPEGVSVFSAVFCRFWKNLLIFFIEFLFQLTSFIHFVIGRTENETLKGLWQTGLAFWLLCLVSWLFILPQITNTNGYQDPKMKCFWMKHTRT